MGRPARPLGVRLGSAAVLVAALLVVAAPLAAAKPAPPPATTAPTKAAPPEPAEQKPAGEKPAGKKAETPPPTPRPRPQHRAARGPGLHHRQDRRPLDRRPAARADRSSRADRSAPTDPPPDPQPNPRITVTPHTDLQDGQTVQIDGPRATRRTRASVRRSAAPVPPTSTTATSAVRSSPRPDDDGTGPRRSSSARGSGSATRSSTAVGGRLRLGAARTSDYQEVAGVDVEPSIPNSCSRRRRSVSVSPDADLVHDQQVTVTGTGFTPGDHVYIQQCADRGPVPRVRLLVRPRWRSWPTMRDTSTSFASSASSAIRAKSLIDCADADCYIQMSSQSDRSPRAGPSSASIPTEPSRRGRPAPRRRTGISSTTRPVDVTGAGFAPFEAVQDQRSARLPTPIRTRPAPTPASAIPAVGTGRRRRQPVDDVQRAPPARVRPHPVARVVDCAEKPGCVIRVSSYENLLHSVDIPIAFDPDVPLPPPPTLTDRPGLGI